jgi:hypothetical protein
VAERVSGIGDRVSVRHGVIAMAVCLLASACPAQEVYATWDQLFVKPQVPVRAIADEGDLTLLFFQTYPSSIHGLRVSIEPGQPLEATEPATLSELPPTIMAPVHLRLKRTAPTADDTVMLRLGLTATNLTGPETVEVRVPLTPRGETLVNDALTVPVGEVQVVVTHTGRFAYWGQGAAVVVLLVWLLWRKRRLNRGSAKSRRTERP